MSRSLKHFDPTPAIQGAVIPLLIAVAWEAASRRSTAYAYAFASVDDILRSLIELVANGELPLNLLATLETMSLGLVIGGTTGIVVGAAMGASRVIARLVGPLYHTVRQVPLLGWIPLIGLWFGNGLFSKTLIVCLAAFYPMVLNTYEGIRNVDVRHLEIGRVYRFSRWQNLRHVQIPGALPAIITGLAQALAFAWISTVGSELLFTSGPGLGGLMQTAQAGSRMDVVVLCVASIGVTGMTLNYGLHQLSHHLLRWRATR